MSNRSGTRRVTRGSALLLRGVEEKGVEAMSGGEADKVNGRGGASSNAK